VLGAHRHIEMHCYDENAATHITIDAIMPTNTTSAIIDQVIRIIVNAGLYNFGHSATVIPGFGISVGIGVNSSSSVPFTTSNATSNATSNGASYVHNSGSSQIYTYCILSLVASPSI